MAEDIDGNVLAVGDTVICCEEGRGTFIKNDRCYTVEKIKDISIKVQGLVYWFTSNRFRKASEASISLENKADRIMALINGRPWSPSREEILEILRS